MKTFFKIIKTFVIIIALLLVLVYGTVFLGHKFLFKEQTSAAATIPPAQNDEFTLGVQAHTQPQTMDEYITLLAGQIKNYHRLAPTLWPDSALTNRAVIVETIESGKFWHLSPTGEVTPLTKEQALAYGISRAIYQGGFSEFDGGIYLAVSEASFHNVLSYQQYLHLGTYDPFITFAHEDFHLIEQPKWAKLDNNVNTARGEFLEDSPARAKRDLLQRQLLKAIASPGDENLILEALSTYDDYQVQFPKDFQNSLFADRIEGTAYYYELISCLYAAYPDKIKTPADLQRALALLATRPDVYVIHGLTAEGYNVGGFAGILLDRLEDNWQTRLMADSKLTPISMLRAHFASQTLPPPQEVTSDQINALSEQLEAVQKDISGIARLFTALYQLLF